VEEAAIGTGADFVDDVGLEIAVDGSRDIFALAGFGKEGAEALIRFGGLALLGQVSIGLDTVLKAVELPARIGNLATSLTDVDADNFSHFG